MLLRERGERVAAAALRLWPGGEARSCCSPTALQRARACAHALGLSFEEIDDEERFRRLVVEPFVAGYLAGLTPNPCVVCNRFRLADLVVRARRRGLGRVATGHYARLVWHHGEPFVARATHLDKDQSYMLWQVAPETLARLQFPLGELDKGTVREFAAKAGLPVAEQPESQEACFAPAGYRRFLQQWGVEARPGLIVTAGGCSVGTHQGQWDFTVGQRRGLGVASAAPLYVLARRGESNEVVVGPRERLMVRSFTLDDVIDRGLGDGQGLVVQLRYRSAAVPVRCLTPAFGGGLRVELVTPFEGVAPGQSAVFYDGDRVIGGGVIGEGSYDTLP